MNVDWFITNRCDQASFCLFCYAPWNYFPRDVSLAESLRIADRLAEIGVEYVTICGGEPFMYPGLNIVVKKLHELGIKVVLYTSATSKNFSLEEFFPYIEFLSLPVDAVTPHMVSKMRGVSQFVNVSHVLRDLASAKDRPRVKVGTVVTKQNVADIPNVRFFLEETSVVDVWRLYQFSPYGIGKHNQIRMLLRDEDFAEALKLIAKSKLRVSGRSREDTLGYCMIIDSRGAFYRYDEAYVLTGMTIYDDVKMIEERYNNHKHLLQKAWLED